MVAFLMLVVLLSVIDTQVGFTKEDGMKKEDFQISVDGRRVEFTKPSIFLKKDNVWMVPLADFTKQLGLKVEYPNGENIAVLCGGTESKLCVPLRFQDSKNGVVHIHGVVYVQTCERHRTFRLSNLQKIIEHAGGYRPSAPRP